MATIMVDDSENLEKAIKRFKRMVEKEGIIREYKKREYFEKPSATLHQKKTTLERKLLNKRRKTEKKDYQAAMSKKQVMLADNSFIKKARLLNRAFQFNGGFDQLSHLIPYTVNKSI